MLMSYDLGKFAKRKYMLAKTFHGNESLPRT